MTSYLGNTAPGGAPRGRFNRLRQITWCVAAITLTGPMAVAHHSFAMFDQAKEVTLQGTVKEFQWTNPHSFIELAAMNADGSVDIWSVELNSPNNLKRQGWKSDSLQTGDKVTLVLNPLRDGRKGGLFISVTRPDGLVLGDPTRRGGGPINVPAVK
jgi:Family of unknown function (DUF6152)